MEINESNGLNGRGKSSLKSLDIREVLNTQQSLILVNGIEYKIDLPLPHSHACKFPNNMYWTWAQNARKECSQPNQRTKKA